MTTNRDNTGTGAGHMVAWELLPWYANGSLESGELDMVERHLGGCSRCQQEVAYLRQLAQLLTFSGEDAPHVEAPLQEALDRIDRLERRRSWPLLSRFWDGLLARRVLASLVALQALVILALGVALWQRPVRTESEFRTLTNPVETTPADALVVRVVFAAGTTEQDLRKLLLDLGGSIVDGPSAYGVYTVELGPLADPGAVATLLERVRARSEVQFLEPLPQPR